MKKKLKKKLIDIFNSLRGVYGIPDCPLIHKSSFELLVAVILSAQCTDKRVNAVTAVLFENYSTPESLADINPVELENIIKSVGLFRAKSANIINTAKKICKEFSGSVPETMNELLLLPGVGRKTANVVLGNAFDIPGFPVDTHVIRLMNRIGIVNTRQPEKIESVVTSHLPAEYWKDFSHLLITHGRACCRAAKPDCENCELRNLCGKICHRNL